MQSAYQNTLYPYHALIGFLEVTGPVKQREFRVVCRAPVDEENAKKFSKDEVYMYGPHGITSNDPAHVKARLTKTLPFKTLQVGAQYDGAPRINQGEWVAAEFKVDIDLDDYTHLGAKASDQAACDRCLTVALFGMQLLECMLESDFGYTATMGVYSGRRGLHMWVLDAACVHDDGTARGDKLAHFKLADATAGGKTDRADGLRAMPERQFSHPNIRCHLSKCLAFFKSWMLKPETQGGGGIFDTDEGVEAFWQCTGITSEYFLELLPSVLLRRNPIERFHALLEATQRFDKARTPSKPSDPASDYFYSAETAVHRAVMAYVWPRFDEAVTIQKNHGLKAPFVAHPKTDRICLPIFRNEWMNFDVATVPTATQLVDRKHPEHGMTRAHFARVLSRFVSAVVTDLQPKGAAHAAQTAVGTRVLMNSAASDDVEDLVVCATRVAPPAPAKRIKSAQTAVPTISKFTYHLAEPVWIAGCNRSFHVRLDADGQMSLGVAVFASLQPNSTQRFVDDAAIWAKDSTVIHLPGRNVQEDDNLPSKLMRLVDALAVKKQGEIRDKWFFAAREDAFCVAAKSAIPNRDDFKLALADVLCASVPVVEAARVRINPKCTKSVRRSQVVLALRLCANEPLLALSPDLATGLAHY